MMSNDFKELEGLSKEERELALKILSEYSTTGSSSTYNELLVSDYEEIPVDIETFLHTPKYLGRGLVNEEGRFTVYRYWVDTLKKIFPDPLKPAQYNTLALTGAIGLGKSFMAVLCGLYELYRMLCLKDPYLHYGLQPIDKITFAIMNITLDAAQGVGWDKLQQLAQSSEWFMSHGEVSKSNNPVWSPSKKIELICGSLSRHIIGRAVYFCLDADTIVSTLDGDYAIKDLVDKDIQVKSIDNDGNVIISDTCTVKPTKVSTKECQIELEDGTVIKCTPEHRFMLTDGSYKEAQYLNEDDDILEYTPIGYIYRVKNKNTGVSYIGQHKKSYFDKEYLGSGLLITRAVRKYGKSSFNIEVLAWAKTIDELNELETRFIKEERLTNNKCLNLSDGALGGHENYNRSPKNYKVQTLLGKKAITNGIDQRFISDSESLPGGWYYGNCKTSGNHNMSNYWNDAEARERMSKSHSGRKNSQYGNGDAHRGPRNGRYGKPCPQHVKEATSLANKGKKYSDAVNRSKGRPGVPKPHDFGKKVSSTSTGKKAYNNGSKNIWVMKGSKVPEGFVEGWIKK